MSILINNKHNFAFPVGRRVAEPEMYVRVCVQGKYRGTQRQFSEKYLFGRRFQI